MEILPMLVLSFFRHLKLDSGRGRPSGSRRRPRQRPRLEVLEDRTVPSTLTVTSAADDGSAGTLRGVLAGAQSGDTIQFAHQLRGQTIILTQGQLEVSQSLGIDGPGADRLTISGNAASRIFAIDGGAAVTLSGLTLTQGLATDGAGILNGGNLTLTHDALSGNVAQGLAGDGLFGDGGGRGGGVENQAGATLDVADSTFTDNQARGGAGGGNAFGGGIYNEAGTVTIDQSVFTGNQAEAADGGTVGVAVTLPGGATATLLGVAGGGAVWNDGGTINLSNGTLADNLDQGGSNGDAHASTARFPFVGTAVGGALGSGSFFTTATPTLTIASSTLSDNQAQGGTNVVVAGFLTDHGSARGGAVGVVAGNLAISQSTVTDNLAAGGALFTIVRAGSPFSAFGSPTFGGGIDDEFDLSFALPPVPLTLDITDSTISGNVAQGNGPTSTAEGGGLTTGQVNVQVSDSTLSGNQAIGTPGGGFNAAHNPGNGGFAEGGGLFSMNGSLTISGSTVQDNLAQAGASGAGAAAGTALGGGIFSGGQSFGLTDSILAGNQSVGGTATLGGRSPGI
jgi:hypothetical protein